MLLVIPFKTDALVAHRPWGTWALIAANVAVASIVGFGGFEDAGLWSDPEPLPANRWALVGRAFDPGAWATHLFIHGGWVHLAGNMLFLWIFGFVVEGSVGWWKFLLIYFGVGIAHGAVEQVAILDAGVVAFGASAAIFGLIGVALIWSPRNTITAFIMVLIVPLWDREIRVSTFALLFVGWEAFLVGLSVFTYGSALAHVVGWFFGLLVGVLFVKQHWVDCWGWDIFSLYERRRVRPRKR